MVVGTVVYIEHDRKKFRRLLCAKAGRDLNVEDQLAGGDFYLAGLLVEDHDEVLALEFRQVVEGHSVTANDREFFVRAVLKIHVDERVALPILLGEEPAVQFAESPHWITICSAEEFHVLKPLLVAVGNILTQKRCPGDKHVEITHAAVRQNDVWTVAVRRSERAQVMVCPAAWERQYQHSSRACKTGSDLVLRCGISWFYRQILVGQDIVENQRLNWIADELSLDGWSQLVHCAAYGTSCCLSVTDLTTYRHGSG